MPIRLSHTTYSVPDSSEHFWKIELGKGAAKSQEVGAAGSWRVGLVDLL